jgi:[acyl-carrier-protein] S-malonyltransferase
MEELTKSNHCQPAIFVTSVACRRALELSVEGPAPVGMGGLSLGEWTALHLAGALTYEDTLRVLEARGRFMQDACEEKDGGMVSVIGLSMDALQEICSATGVGIANLNSPGQTVLSGERQAIESAAERAKAAGAKRAVILQVAGAFHSPLMQSAAERLDAFLKDIPIETPCVPVAANVTGKPHGGPGDICSTMVKQVTQSVDWVSCVQWMKGVGAEEYVECGPGRVLSGLIRRIDPDGSTCHVQDAATLEKAVEALKEGC